MSVVKAVLVSPPTEAIRRNIDRASALKQARLLAIDCGGRPYVRASIAPIVDVQPLCSSWDGVDPDDVGGNDA